MEWDTTSYVEIEVQFEDWTVIVDGMQGLKQILWSKMGYQMVFRD